MPFVAKAFLALAATPLVEGSTPGIVGRHQQEALVQTWTRALENSDSANPVKRVVNLLKEMHQTLQTEMEEDEELFEKLECWCSTGKYEKKEAIEAGNAKMDELSSADEQGFAHSKELKIQIGELEAQVASDKEALATASAKREEDLQAFQGMETDSIQALENLKAALVVLSKHHDAAFPQISLSLLSVSGTDEPMSAHVEERALEAFMQNAGYGSSSSVDADRATQKFLKTHGTAPHASWTSSDVSVVRKAVKSVAALAQSSHRYYPSYNAQSGEIVGIIKTMKEQMEAELKESQESENAQASAFAEMRSAKQAAIEAGEKMAEQKEDELAKTDNLVAEAKEDLGQTDTKLQEDKTFLANLEKMCSTADSAFEKRKEARLEEIKAVAETIEILTADEARDAMSGTYSLLQVSSENQDRKKAAAILRQIARKTGNIDISFLASHVELDAFTKVKKAIDDMISTLQVQQEDEVKKNNYCKDELQKTEMTIMKTNDLKADLEAKVAELESNIVTFIDEIASGKAAIKQAQLDLQRASEDRLTENQDFQKTIADQTMTIEVLHKARERLAQFYDQEFLLQQKSRAASMRQTPPVVQKEYKPNEGAGGVMSMIEKLVSDAKGLVADSKKSENDAQVAYETLVADTNADVDDLANEVTSKTKALAKAEKGKLGAQSDLMDTVDELEGLHKYEADVHAECDYVVNNFDVRQQSRAQEIEALQQAKQILNGANLS